ncbi:hypothetical protein MR988_08220 [bacterium]|nr:hypothetical protein [bacterium]
MEVVEKITLDMLTPDSVSVLKQQFVNINGSLVQAGSNIRNAYINSTTGRDDIKNVLTEPYLSSVMAVWGSTPTVSDPIDSTEKNNKSEVL